MKQEKEPGTNYFDTEKKVYHTLRRHCGVLLPYYYGEASCMSPFHSPKRAHVISEAKGKCLLEVPKETRPEVVSKLERTLAQISKCGIIHADPLPDHVFINDNGAMLIDWELAEFDTVDQAEKMNKGDLTHMLHMVAWEY
jgi:tRNA A-37 threonylcarbamoyl transferase component Bud32